MPSPACTRSAASPAGQEQALTAPGRRAGTDRPGTGSFLFGHNFILRPKLVPSGTGKTASPNPPCRLQGLGWDQNLGPLLLFLHLPRETRPLQQQVSPHNPPPRSAQELTPPHSSEVCSEHRRAGRARPPFKSRHRISTTPRRSKGCRNQPPSFPCAPAHILLPVSATHALLRHQDRVPSTASARAALKKR